MGFNVTYLLDVLANLKSEQVELRARRRARQRADHDARFSEKFKYVVMPMRI
ncbi:MAG: hypothetical protein MZW92_18770 [Comamonadaceae bacterium]|nr:hypothetical protein [Comamonadaceae bacterium]